MTTFRKYVKNRSIYLVVGIITTLLLLNVVLVKINSDTIEKNIKIQEEAERIKIIGNDIITNLHALDLGIRGYALIPEDYILEAADYAQARHALIIDSLENMLLKQGFVEMSSFYQLKEVLGNYYDTAQVLEKEIQLGNTENFMAWLSEDPGYDLFIEIERFNKVIFQSQDTLIETAYTNYHKALRTAFLLQIFLFLISFPTLLVTAIFTRKAFKANKKLRILEKEKNDLLANQNRELERLVDERTYEIQRQNEEIQAQNEEIIAQNDSISITNDELLAKQTEIVEQRDLVHRINEELKASQEIIEFQTSKIEEQNKDLQKQVNAQTEHLKIANEELLEQNQRLEQFAYIISHNLRSPIARILGLVQVIDLAKNQEEEKVLLGKLKETSSDIDVVIKDLMTIIEVRRGKSEPKIPIPLSQVYERTLTLLQTEIDLTQTQLIADFQIENILSIPSYVESVFFNLISNAIKYRKYDEPALIHVKSYEENGSIKISFQDQGLGMDTEIVKHKLFTPFKRFHNHVEGKGLGLYLVKSQALLLGGNLDVESSPGQGSTFILSLPKEK